MPMGIYQRKARSLEDRLWKKVDKNGPIPEKHPELGPCWVWTGAVSSEYGVIKISGASCKAYMVIFLLDGKEIPIGYELDHICQNKICVNPGHLRAVSHQDNSRHRKKNKNASNRFKGVNKRNQGYEASIGIHGKRLYLGVYKTEEAAHDAYCKKAKEMFGEFASFD